MLELKIHLGIKTYKKNLKNSWRKKLPECGVKRNIDKNKNTQWLEAIIKKHLVTLKSSENRKMVGTYYQKNNRMC